MFARQPVYPRLTLDQRNDSGINLHTLFWWTCHVEWKESKERGKNVWTNERKRDTKWCNMQSVKWHKTISFYNCENTISSFRGINRDDEISNLLNSLSFKVLFYMLYKRALVHAQPPSTDLFSNSCFMLHIQNSRLSSLSSEFTWSMWCWYRDFEDLRLEKPYSLRERRVWVVPDLICKPYSYSTLTFCSQIIRLWWLISWFQLSSTPSHLDSCVLFALKSDPLAKNIFITPLLVLLWRK